MLAGAVVLYNSGIKCGLGENMRKFLHDYFYQMNLKTKIRSVFLGTTCMYLIFIFAIIMTLVSQAATQHVTVQSRTAIESIGENLNATMQSISNMTHMIMSDEEVIQYLKFGKRKDSFSAASSVRQISAHFDSIHSIFLIADNDSYISTGGRFTRINPEIYMEESWKNELDDRKGGYILRLNGGGLFKTDSQKDIISLMRKAYDVNTQIPIGYIVVNVPADILNGVSLKLNTDISGYRFMDLDGSCLEENYEPQFTNLRGNTTKYTQDIEKTIHGMEIMTTVLCANDSFRVGIVENISFMVLLKEQVNILWVALIIAIVVSFFLLGAFVRRTITNPIAKLCHSMEQVKSGYFRRVSLKLPNDEIGKLKDTYNNMLVETNNLISELVEQEKKVQNAELRILQEQINPHFLYNTLDTIGYMIWEKPPEEAYDAVETLGSFYRRFLSKGKNTITLEDEINIVKDYMKLQKLRYEDIFEDTYDLPDKEVLRKIQIPKLTLQPLIENSIYHGLKLKGEKGTIHIQIKCEETDVVITVHDSGIGMTQEEMENYLYREDSKSFGFKGTVERLENYYQKKGICTAQSEKGKFFEVCIRIPNQG